ncbi:MAG TPA: hypothetical protein VEB21_10430, partial [Terriglobales bacterium]|nr:hypothetical protein [Terriglobales bacterium]
MQYKGVSTGWFALLAKLAAVGIAAGGFVVLRLPEPPARLVIVAMPDAQRDWIRDGMDSDSEVGNGGFAGSVGGIADSGIEFWRDLFALAPPVDGGDE